MGEDSDLAADDGGADDLAGEGGVALVDLAASGEAGGV